MAENATQEVVFKSTCAGGEVRAALHLLVSYYRAKNHVSVNGMYDGLQLF